MTGGDGSSPVAMGERGSGGKPSGLRVCRRFTVEMRSVLLRCYWWKVGNNQALLFCSIDGYFRCWRCSLHKAAFMAWRHCIKDSNPIHLIISLHLSIFSLSIYLFLSLLRFSSLLSLPLPHFPYIYSSLRFVSLLFYLFLLLSHSLSPPLSLRFCEPLPPRWRAARPADGQMNMSRAGRWALIEADERHVTADKDTATRASWTRCWKSFRREGVPGGVNGLGEAGGADGLCCQGASRSFEGLDSKDEFRALTVLTRPL